MTSERIEIPVRLRQVVEDWLNDKAAGRLTLTKGEGTIPAIKFSKEECGRISLVV